MQDEMLVKYSARQAGIAILRPVALIAVLLALCVNTLGQDSPREDARTAAGPESALAKQSGRPVLQQRFPRYRVSRSDVLNLSFPLSPDFSRKVTVQPDGFINLQSAGSLYVQGLTVPEIVEGLKKAYATILHNPIIDVDLIDFQKPSFIVGGQVNRPGQYDLRQETTLSQAIAISGGLASGGKTQVLLLHRVSNQWVEIHKFDLKDIYKGVTAAEDPEVQPGDMIFVPETFISNVRKYIPYTVGTYLDPRSVLGR